MTPGDALPLYVPLCRCDAICRSWWLRYDQKGMLAIMTDVSELSGYCWRGLLANLVYMASIQIWWDNCPLLKDKC